MRAGEIGAASHLRDVRESTTDVPCSGPENHLKKVPVLEAGHIVVSSTAATSPSTPWPPYWPTIRAYRLLREGPGQHGVRGRGLRELNSAAPASEGTGLCPFGKPRGQLPWVKKTPGSLEVRFGVVRASSIFDFDSSCFQSSCSMATRKCRSAGFQYIRMPLSIFQGDRLQSEGDFVGSVGKERIYRLPLRSLGSTSNRSACSARARTKGDFKRKACIM